MPSCKKILHEEQPTLLMLQETKVQDDDFPFNEFVNIGYKIFISGKNHTMVLLFFQN